MKARVPKLLIGALLLAPSTLVAQGTASVSLPRVPRPQELLLALAGAWRFEMYSRGSTRAVESGQREMRLLDDSVKLTWTEHFGDRSDVGTGILGYNATIDTFYLLGAYTHEPGPLVLSGRGDLSARVISFGSTGEMVSPGTFVRSELRLIDADHFEWVASDGSWRAGFTRVGKS